MTVDSVAGIGLADINTTLQNGNKNVSELIAAIQALAKLTPSATSISLGGATLDVTSFTLTAATRANPCVMTIPGHTMVVGDFYFISGVSGMTELNSRWFKVAAVSGNNITVNNCVSVAGAVVDGGALDSTGFGVYTSGGTVKPQITRGTWPWPLGVSFVHATVHGSGAAGGGSSWTQLAGAGGSGAIAKGIVPRPANGVSTYQIDHGMPGVPANTIADLSLQSGITAFGTISGTTPVNIAGDLWAAFAGIGQNAANAAVGGDGGSGGIAGGTYHYNYKPGGQGQASGPTVLDGGASRFNTNFPAGASAPEGGAGGNNGQDGQYPGGGGSPGNNNTTPQPGAPCTGAYCNVLGREVGQSGAGAPGQIELWYLQVTT